MDLRTYRNTFLLLRQIINPRISTVPVIQTAPHKPVCSSPAAVDRPFPRTSPEEQGLSSEHLAHFFDELNQDETLDLHSIMVLRNGCVVAEGSFGAYDRSLWHVTHSACKSITGLAIGMLCDEGRLNLDERLVRIFEPHLPGLAMLTHKDLTVEHLLKMASGISFNEPGAVTESDWVRSYLESAIRGDPGRRFEYNSMNTYLLAAVVRQVSGQSLQDFLRERLWQPLGIHNLYWETCPHGIEKGGWGLYIRLEDLAKIGQLVLQKGRWQGRQLISEAWIRLATSRQIKTPESLGDFDYGYQIWSCRKRDSFLFSGMFGQNVLGFPESGLLLVSNAGNNELFQKSSYFGLVDKYFPTGASWPDKLPEDPLGLHKLHDSLQKLGRPAPICPSPERPLYLKQETLTDRQALLARLDGQAYQAEEAEAASVGLLPLFAQVIQNNYTQGMKSLGFSLQGGEFILTVEEKGETYQLPLGFDRARRTVLQIRGEPYPVAAAGTFTADEDGRLVLKIRVSFLEIANARLLKIFFHDSLIHTKWQESPGKEYFSSGMAVLGQFIKVGPFYRTILSKADTDYVVYKLNNVFEPEITFRRV